VRWTDDWRAPALSLVLVGFAGIAQAQATFTGVGDLAGGEETSAAYGVSADGNVAVGHSVSASGLEAFRWTAAGGIVGLGSLQGEQFGFHSSARGASADGSVVVGYSDSELASAEAFRWTAAGGMEGLGSLMPNSTSEATAVSADGSVVVGNATASSGERLAQMAFRWTESAGMVRLGWFPGPVSVGSWATAVSADGSVVVGAGDLFVAFSSGSEAFRWTLPGGMARLGTLPRRLFSWAEAVSVDGSVVVGRIEWGPPRTGFRWTSQTGIVDLGTLPGAQVTSALGVSADGSTIVGFSAAAFELDAVLWTPSDGMRRLKEVLLEEGAAEVAGWRLNFARGISSDGRTIVGDGLNPSGRLEGWVAVLPPRVAECGNGADDDGDGLADFPEDPGCASASDLFERDAFLACDDGLDEDGDDLADFPADPGCASPAATQEQRLCNDGFDNDFDGTIDFDGGAAANHGVPLGAPDPKCSTGAGNLEMNLGCGLGGAEATLALLVWRAFRRRRAWAGARDTHSRR